MIAAELLGHGVSTLGESGGRLLTPGLTAVWPGARLAGPAYPVRLGDGDNLAIHVACAEAPAGSVLVVEATRPRELGYWGEVLATQAVSRGLAGLVIDGGCRDVAALERHGFPVFAACVAAGGATKVAGGSVGIPVEIRGVQVSAGDWVVADGDGVVVIAATGVDAVLTTAQLRTTTEAAIFRALADGATTVELLGLDATAVARPGADPAR